MIDKAVTLALFPFYMAMRVFGVVVIDLLELRDELRCPVRAEL